MENLLGNLLIESSIDAMIALDPAGCVTVWNRAAAILYEKQPEDALGKLLTELLPSIKDDADLCKAINRAKEGIQSFVPSSRQQPHRLHVEMHVIPLKTRGELVGMMLLVHDVGHRILKESELHYLNNELNNRLRQLSITNRELAYLTRIATDNLKEPIRNIYTGIELLIEKEAKAMSNSGKASFRRIQSSLGRMGLLLDDIITLTQIDIINKPDALVNLEVVLSQIIKKYEQKIRDFGATVIVGELCEIKAHEKQVELLILQLLNNVLRFNRSERPFVKITCRKMQVEKNKMMGEGGTFFELSITHNGHGFYADMEKIVSAYETGKENNLQGQGIAPIVAAKIMEAHAGFLVVENDGESGSVIKCYFPAEVNEKEMPPAS